MGDKKINISLICKMKKHIRTRASTRVNETKTFVCQTLNRTFWHQSNPSK